MEKFGYTLIKDGISQEDHLSATAKGVNDEATKRAVCACCASTIPDTIPTPNVIANPIPKVKSFGCVVMRCIIFDFKAMFETSNDVLYHFI